MKTICENFRFVERGQQGRDLTFKFYKDGRLIIIDNGAEEVITPKDLRADSTDFYIRKRLAFIRNQLVASKLKYA
ncbi:hypothetical protein D3C87_2021660 [compost metagenome]